MEIEDCFFDTTDYEMTTKLLGKGSFGKVYVVKNQTNELLYAAKIINTNGVFKSRDQLLFLRESLILHKLNHPSIVKFYGINFHSIDDPISLNPTILTEYHSKGSLKSILDKEKKNIADHNWTPTKKYICLLGISDAMRYLHRAGILHRDLKPQNILIDDNYYPKVCDFGFARCFAKALTNSMQLSMTGQFGTPLYMAPELFENDDHFSSAVDVYAFALIAYEIVVGKEPFFENGKSIKFTDIFKKIPNGERPIFDTNIQDKMKELIEKCWSQDPKDRPSFDDVFEKLSTDFSYSFEKVDNDEINEFLKILKENRNKNEHETEHKKSINEEETKNLQNEIDKLKSENQNYKNQIKDLQDEIKNLKIEHNTKCIHIKICEFRKKTFGQLKSYVTLQLKSQSIYHLLSSKTISNTNNLVWNEEFNLLSTNKRDDVLIINMYDNDPKGTKKMIDQLEFPINEWKANSPVDRKEIDTKLMNKKVGTLIFEVQAFRSLDDYIKSPRKKKQLFLKTTNNNEILADIFMLHGTTCGQSTLLKRLTEGIYYECLYPTIGTNFDTHICNIDGCKINLRIWDSSYQEKLMHIVKNQMKNSSGFIINFDITDEDSFRRISNWINELKLEDYSDTDIPIVLVGNKLDLNNSRKVSYEEAKNLATENGFQYFETSAKENKGIDELLQFLAKYYIKYSQSQNAQKFPKTTINHSIKIMKKKD